MKRSYLLLHVAVMLAGFTGIFGKLISLKEGLLVWYRVFFAFLILLVLVKLLRIPSHTSRQEKLVAGSVGMLIATHWLFFYASIKYSNVSIGVICYCLTGFFTALFEPLINKKKIRPTELMLSGLTVLGISLIFHFDVSYQTGILLGVISSAFAALYTVYNERLVKRYDTRLINYYQMAGATAGLGAILPAYIFVFHVQQVLPSAEDTVYLVLLAGFCTVGLYILFAESLKKIPAFTVNLSFNLEPVYAIILAFLLFGEGRELNASFYVGLFFVMASVALQTFIAMRSARVSLKE